MLSFDTKDLSNFIGKHFIFTYKNGWNYELYIKNKEQIDYRVHSGIISNHWMKNQNIY